MEIDGLTLLTQVLIDWQYILLPSRSSTFVQRYYFPSLLRVRGGWMQKLSSISAPQEADLHFWLPLHICNGLAGMFLELDDMKPLCFSWFLHWPSQLGLVPKRSLPSLFLAFYSTQVFPSVIYLNVYSWHLTFWGSINTYKHRHNS